MTEHTTNFVLRVKETKGTLRLSVHNLKTGERKAFSTWRDLVCWLEQQVSAQGLR